MKLAPIKEPRQRQIKHPKNPIQLSISQTKYLVVLAIFFCIGSRSPLWKYILGYFLDSTAVIIKTEIHLE